MIQITLPSAVAQITGVRRCQLEDAATVQQALEVLLQRYPALRREFLDESGMLEMHVIISVNDQQLSELEGLDTPLKDGDEISIFLALSGG
ncbi:MAG: ubiquitin-like small modifier protein 1 [bacterium]